jgi:hypothetical protein
MFAAAALAVPSAAVWASEPLPMISVWKDPACGCCLHWIAYMQAKGYAVDVFDVPNLAEPRRRVGMPSKYRSCHVARIGTYAIEGHVPVEDIERLLAERPEAIGLAVPGMPYGAPGIGTGTRRVDFEVLLIQRDGRARTYARYAARA